MSSAPSIKKESSPARTFVRFFIISFEPGSEDFSSLYCQSPLSLTARLQGYDYPEKKFRFKNLFENTV